jgi:hypothetical protein
MSVKFGLLLFIIIDWTGDGSDNAAEKSQDKDIQLETQQRMGLEKNISRISMYCRELPV